MFVVSPKPIPNPLFPYWESQILKMIDPDWTNLIMVVPFPLSLINLVVGLSWPMKCVWNSTGEHAFGKLFSVWGCF